MPLADNAGAEWNRQETGKRASSFIGQPPTIATIAGALFFEYANFRAVPIRPEILAFPSAEKPSAYNLRGFTSIRVMAAEHAIRETQQRNQQQSGPIQLHLFVHPHAPSSFPPKKGSHSVFPGI